MKTVLEHAAREFIASEQIRNVYEGKWHKLYDEAGSELKGIRGRIGAYGMSISDHEIGVDMIEMEKGSGFPLHVHPGDHILFIYAGSGVVTVGAKDYHVGVGDTIYIPAEFPHAVSSPETSMTFLAFGHPHNHLESTQRMRSVKDAGHLSA